MSSSPNEPTTVKTLLVYVGTILGAVGNILGFFNQLPANARLNVLLALIFSLFLLVIGLLTVRESKVLLKAVSIVALVMGGIGLIYFGFVGCVLLFTKPPDTQGSLIKETDKSHGATLQLEKNQIKNGLLISEQTIEFVENADFAAVEFVLSDKDKDLAEGVRVTPNLPAGIKKSEMQRDEYYEDGFYVEPTKKSLKIPIKIEVALKKNNLQSPVEVNVFYKFWRKDWKWEVLQWIHGKYP